MATVHERIKELRIKNGLTQVDLANELGVTHQVISFYENGREPSYDILIKIAEFFNVSLDYLLGKSNFKNFQDEYDYKNRIGNEQLLSLFPESESILISINEHFSAILKDLIVNNDSRHSKHALVALNQIFFMIRYIKETIGECFADMESYLNLLRILSVPKAPILPNIEEIEIKQAQIEGCKRELNKFIHLYVYTIFDFEKMKLKEGD